MEGGGNKFRKWKDFTAFQNELMTLEPTGLPIPWVLVPPHPGVNITRCDVDHSPATTAAVKNEWSQNPHAAIRHSNLNRETSALSFCLLYISSSLLLTYFVMRVYYL